MTDTAGGAALEQDAAEQQEPIPVDPTTPPSAVIRALGFDPETVKSLVITSAGVVAVAADYPPTAFDPDPEPEPAPQPDPDPEEDPDAHA